MASGKMDDSAVNDGILILVLVEQAASTIVSVASAALVPMAATGVVTRV